MAVRAKLRCIEKSERAAYPSQEAAELGFDVQVEIKLQPMFEGGGSIGEIQNVNAIEENRIFGLATPSAQFAMLIQNRAAADQFEVGSDYYVDFTPADA